MPSSPPRTGDPMKRGALLFALLAAVAISAARADTVTVIGGCVAGLTTPTANSCVQRDGSGAIAATAATIGATLTSGTAISSQPTYADTAGSNTVATISGAGIATSAPNTGLLTGIAAQATIGASNTQNWTGSSARSVIGSRGNATITNGASGTISGAVMGFYATAGNLSASATADLVYDYVAPAISCTGTCTRVIGVGVGTQQNGTNNCGVFISVPNGVLTPSWTGNWAICSDSANASYLSGTLFFKGSAPAVTGTGTPTIATGSTDTSGEVTGGTSATSIVITFASAKSNAPFCVVTPQTQVAAFSWTISTSAITITQTATTGQKVDYFCTQN